MRALLPRDEILKRLASIFPRTAFDAVLANPLGSAAVAAMLFIDAVVPEQDEPPDDATWARPSLCLWMNDETYARTDEESRLLWRDAALSSSARKSVAALREAWGVSDDPWYADNSRETLRDETFPEWHSRGALRLRPDVKTTSSAPRWALTDAFADLFSPGLAGDDLTEAIETWRNTHLSPGDLFRITTAQERERQVHAVEITLPGGDTRSLEPGTASLILKGVIEQWAPRRLDDPVVLSISEPGDKVYLADAARLRALGLTIDPSTLLPDALIVDIAADPPTFWIVEAVATDGPVTEERRTHLLRWARDQRIEPDACAFLSAFFSRNDSAARRRLKDLAEGSFAWFLDEPNHELAWYEIIEYQKP